MPRPSPRSPRQPLMPRAHHATADFAFPATPDAAFLTGGHPDAHPPRRSSPDAAPLKEEPLAAPDAARAPRGDGEKTVGEAEKSFIAWRKRYINIPGKPLPHNSRASPNLSPIVQSPDQHSAPGGGYDGVEDMAASPPSPRRSPSPPPPPPRRSPMPPRRSPTPVPPPPPMNQGRRLQTNKPSAPPAKTTKKAPVKPRPIPQKLPGEMSKEELDDAVKKPSKHSS
ncbi:proline-rich receptor-like protein kinase PERK10 [Miscanthus floridulus]|uniref:proline-rich receptor-like protein kinase PERK10 n=1 Tax=Miscanthus floridulus TaxID=154761 RepID=UPI00345B4851